MQISKYIPILEWLPRYRREDLGADLVAGFIVLFMTVPQSIAYAFLAGLPPETGLYTTIFSMLCYAMFGSSKTMSVGPAAIISMMILQAISAVAEPGSADYIFRAGQLCLMTGAILLILRIVNFGAVISFLSHAVVSGFITAAAILIILNQLPTLFGLTSSVDTGMVGVITHIAKTVAGFNSLSLSIGLGALVFLILCKKYLYNWMLEIGVKASFANAIAKSAPMYAVFMSIGLVYFGHFNQTLPIVGELPTNLPGFTSLHMSVADIQLLAPSALLIAMVIFMESTSIGTAVASKRREKIDPNQELVGLGVANVAAAFFSGFPVAGSFSRTIVNFTSGAATQVASLITAVLVLVTLLGFGWFFYYLPKSVLAAIILISAWQLIDWHSISKIFAFNVTDSVTFVFTFLAVLALGVESGILIGIGISFVLLIRSSSRPHIAVVGRWRDSEHFRNSERHDVKTMPKVLAVRVDESFYFVNIRYIETFVLNKIAENPDLEHLLLICTATNFIDISGLEMLELLSDNLAEVNVTLHLAEVKGPVMDKLKKTEFYSRMHGEVFFTTDIAMKKLGSDQSEPILLNVQD